MPPKKVIATIKESTPVTPLTPSQSIIPTKPNLPPSKSIETLLSDIGLSNEQITELLSLEYTDYVLENDEFIPKSFKILSLDDRYFVYELLGLLLKIGYDNTLTYLKSSIWSSRREIIFSMPTLEQSREKLYININIFRNKSIVSEGIFKCNRCGSRRTVSSQKQIRSADEPMTVTVTCLQCSLTWKT